MDILVLFKLIYGVFILLECVWGLFEISWGVLRSPWRSKRVFSLFGSENTLPRGPTWPQTPSNMQKNSSGRRKFREIIEKRAAPARRGLKMVIIFQMNINGYRKFLKIRAGGFLFTIPYKLFKRALFSPLRTGPISTGSL